MFTRLLLILIAVLGLSLGAVGCGGPAQVNVDEKAGEVEFKERDDKLGPPPGVKDAPEGVGWVR